MNRITRNTISAQTTARKSRESGREDNAQRWPDQKPCNVPGPATNRAAPATPASGELTPTSNVLTFLRAGWRSRDVNLSDAATLLGRIDERVCLCASGFWSPARDESDKKCTTKTKVCAAEHGIMRDLNRYENLPSSVAGAVKRSDRPCDGVRGSSKLSGTANDV